VGPKIPNLLDPKEITNLLPFLQLPNFIMRNMLWERFVGKIISENRYPKRSWKCKVLDDSTDDSVFGYC